VTATVSGANPVNALTSSNVLVGGNDNGYAFTVQIFDPQNVVGTATVTLTAYDWCTGLSGQTSFPVVLDDTPALALPNGTSFSRDHNQFPLTFSAVGFSASSPLTVTAVASNSLLYDVQSQYGFTGVGYNTAGPTAYVLESNQPGPGVGGFYLLRPQDGALFPYDGSSSYDNTLNGVPLATLGANVFTDPNLLLNARAPVDYSTLYSLQQQYHFVGLQYFTDAGGNSAYVLEADANNANGNPFYLLRSTDGGLFAYGGGSYADTFADSQNLIATLGVGVYNNPSSLTGAVAPPALYAQLYQLNQQFDLQELNGSFYTDMFGHQAEWFYSPVLNQFGQPWYTLTLQQVNGVPKAVLTAWQGYQDSEVGAVVATLDPSVYGNPGWLTGATAAPALPAGTATIDSSGKVTVNLPSPGFVGTFDVNVTASDGLLSTTKTVTVTSTDAAPTLALAKGSTTVAAGSDQSFPQGDFPQSFTATASSSEPGASVSLSASVSSYSPLFALEQRYRFQGVQYYNDGSDSAYILQAAGNNRNGNPYYLLAPDGGLFAYAGGSYANTFDSAANEIASLGSLVYADPTLLTAALPAIDYAALHGLLQQYHFHGLQYYTDGTANSAYVLQAASDNANGNPFYLLTPAGGLYAYGNGSYADTFANPANLVATVDPDVYVNPTLLTGALATPALYDQLQTVEAARDLAGLQYYVNSGIAAYVLESPQNNFNGNRFYLLLPSGALYAYGGGSYAQTTADANNLVATLDPSVYANPTLLTTAKAPEAAGGVMLSPAAGGSSLTYQVNAPSSFIGTFQVTVTATDGIASTTQTYEVTSTDVPALNPVAPQSVSLASPTLHVTLGSTQPAGDSATYSATVAGYSLPYSLQQQYQFQGLGYFTTSDDVTVYALQIAGTNPNGSSYYLLSASGGLYACDGGNEFGTTLANSANLVAQLSPSVFLTPSLLTNAQPPPAPAAQASVNGNQLTVNVAGLPVGTEFEVFVTVNDGIAPSRTGFVVNVTA
jgi:hypothetical protein